MNDRFSEADSPGGSARRAGAPRWVKVLGVAGGAFVLLFVILHLTGHMPDHHFGNPASHASEMPASKAGRP